MNYISEVIFYQTLLTAAARFEDVNLATLKSGASLVVCAHLYALPVVC